MIMMAAMVFVYGLYSFGEMKKISLFYFGAACINAAFYPLFESIVADESSRLFVWVYTYGVSEEFLKVAIIASIYKKGEHRALILLLCAHMANHTWFKDYDYYDVVNNAIILCEMIYFILKGVKLDFSIFKNVFARNIRINSNSRSSL